MLNLPVSEFQGDRVKRDRCFFSAWITVLMAFAVLRSDLWLNSCVYADSKEDSGKDNKFKGRKAELFVWRKRYDDRNQAAKFIGKWKMKKVVQSGPIGQNGGGNVRTENIVFEETLTQDDQVDGYEILMRPLHC